MEDYIIPLRNPQNDNILVEQLCGDVQALELSLWSFHQFINVYLFT